MGQVDWAALKTSKWSQINGSDPKMYRTWIDSGVQIYNPNADVVAVPEDVVIDVIKYVDDTDPVAISEAIAKEYTKVRNEWEIITDSLSKEMQLPFTDPVAIQEALEYFLSLGRQGEDTITIPEDVTFDVSWHFSDLFPLAEAVAFDVSWTKQDNVGITESVTVVFQMLEDHTDMVGIADEVHILVWDTSESGGMSLVDDVRVAVQTALSLTDEEVADLSINDLLHRYWSQTFGVGHTYEGSDSTFTPAEAHSIMDHHSSVEANEATDLNWIRSVTAT